MVGMLLVRREAQVLTITEEGMGRRTRVDEFPLQNRGGRGTLVLPAEVTKTDTERLVEIPDGAAVVEGEFRLPQIQHVPIEPHVAIGLW